MENLKKIFISADCAKIKTNNNIREREKFYQKKAIDFLNKYNFNEVIEEACCKNGLFSIPPYRSWPR